MPLVRDWEEGTPLPMFLMVLEADMAALSLLLSASPALPDVPGWEGWLGQFLGHSEPGV